MNRRKFISGLLTAVAAVPLLPSLLEHSEKFVEFRDFYQGEVVEVIYFPYVLSQEQIQECYQYALDRVKARG